MSASISHWLKVVITLKHREDLTTTNIITTNLSTNNFLIRTSLRHFTKTENHDIPSTTKVFASSSGTPNLTLNVYYSKLQNLTLDQYYILGTSGGSITCIVHNDSENNIRLRILNQNRTVNKNNNSSQTLSSADSSFSQVTGGILYIYRDDTYSSGSMTGIVVIGFAASMRA